MRDIHNNLEAVIALNTAAIVSDTTTAGEIIDMQDRDGCEFVVQSGVITDGTYTILIESGDVANLSDAVAVSDTYLLGTEGAFGTPIGSPLTGVSNEINKVGVKAHHGKRYVRLSIVSTGTSTGGTMGAIAMLGNMVKPV